MTSDSSQALRERGRGGSAAGAAVIPSSEVAMTQPEELVIHRRGALVFLRKPAGLPVFPPHADPEGDCLLSRWLECEPGLASVDWP
jgi:23S rRNA-/tRNA-specific pseudouridylate synthase